MGGPPGAYAAAMEYGSEQGSAGVQGKTVLITGATGGIGLETARALARQGARVVIVGRDPDKTARVAGEIGAAAHLLGDLSELRQVQRVAGEFRERHGKLDLLINNAGALYNRREETREGIERTWALNHLSPFLLTRELLPLLHASAERRGEPARVITVSSAAHAFGRLRFEDPEFRTGYSAWGAYAQSKLANVLFARELARRESGLLSGALHPGMVNTGFGKNGGGRMARAYHVLDRFSLSAEEGAQTTLFLASTSQPFTGKYFANSRPAPLAPQAEDDGAAARLWILSERYVADVLGERSPHPG